MGNCMMNKFLGRSKFIRWVWSRVYRKHLYFYNYHWKVIRVKSWRTAIVEAPTNRMTITPCFWGLK